MGCVSSASYGLAVPPASYEWLARAWPPRRGRTRLPGRARGSAGSFLKHRTCVCDACVDKQHTFAHAPSCRMLAAAAADDAAWDAACLAQLEAAEARLRADSGGGGGASHEHQDEQGDDDDDPCDGASEAGEDEEELADAEERDAEDGLPARWAFESSDASAPVDGAADADDVSAEPAAPDAKRPRQLDIRAWFGGIPPPPPPPPPPLVQRDIRAWFGGGRSSEPAAAPAAPAAPVLAVAAAPRSCPFYKRVAGTPFAVDAFSYGAVPGVKAYFLSHFHADHYIGLGPRWDGGPIYCTAATARLAALRLRAPAAALRPLALGVRTLVCGVWVTLLDANHCPGAALLLFAPPGAPPDAPLTLHTGDFRASAALLARPEISRLAGRLSACYLDTTYCDERYAFPDQEAALADVAARALAARAQRPRTLFLVGAYAIGKERVALAIAAALNCSICVDAGRAALAACFDWPQLAARLTRRPEATPLHVVPIAWLNAAKLSEYLAAQGPRYDCVLAFRPTGWTHTQQGGGKPGAPAGAARVRIVGVPYSEHSSAAELRAFVRALRPRRIVPTVGCGSAAKRAQMERLFDQWLAERGSD
jgi:DNA cross-link repair 1A protein